MPFLRSTSTKRSRSARKREAEKKKMLEEAVAQGVQKWKDAEQKAILEEKKWREKWWQWETELEESRRKAERDELLGGLVEWKGRVEQLEQEKGEKERIEGYVRGVRERELLAEKEEQEKKKFIEAAIKNTDVFKKMDKTQKEWDEEFELEKRWRESKARRSERRTSSMIAHHGGDPAITPREYDYEDPIRSPMSTHQEYLSRVQHATLQQVAFVEDLRGKLFPPSSNTGTENTLVRKNEDRFNKALERLDKRLEGWEKKEEIQRQIRDMAYELRGENGYTNGFFPPTTRDSYPYSPLPSSSTQTRSQQPRLQQYNNSHIQNYLSSYPSPSNEDPDLSLSSAQSRTRKERCGSSLGINDLSRRMREIEIKQATFDEREKERVDREKMDEAAEEAVRRHLGERERGWGWDEGERDGYRRRWEGGRRRRGWEGGYNDY